MITSSNGVFGQGMLALQELYSLWGSVRKLAEMPVASCAAGIYHSPHNLIFNKIKNTYSKFIDVLETRVSTRNAIAADLAGSPKVQDHRGIKLRSCFGSP